MQETSLNVSVSRTGTHEWDAFVASHHGATFFHQHRWLDLVKRVYGGEPYYLAARAGTQVVGVLPLMLRRLLGAGRVLISVPFADEGGVCADTPEAQAALLEAAKCLGYELSAQYVQLRQLDRPLEGVDAPCDSSRVVMRRSLPADDDEFWKSLSSNMRKKVRRSKRDGLATTDSGADGVHAFYDVYAWNMRDLGSPMHSRRYFEALFDLFPDACWTVLVEAQGGIAGAAVAVLFRGVMTVLCAHSLRAYHRHFPNDLLYYRLLESAVERGCTVADFGRSPKGSGIYEFKKRWGLADHPLYYSALPVRSTPKPGERQAGLGYRVFSGIWRRTPISVARVLGPRIFARLQI